MVNILAREVRRRTRMGRKHDVALLQNRKTRVHITTVTYVYNTSVHIRRLDSCPRVRSADTPDALCIPDFIPHNAFVTYAYNTSRWQIL